MAKVTPEVAQRRALQAFQRFVKSEGRPPSLRELSRTLGMSEVGVQKTVDALIADGRLLAKTRTVRVIKAISAAGLRWLEETDTKEE